MDALTNKLTSTAIKALKALYSIDNASVEWQLTRKDFEGDVTLVVFPYLRFSKSSPEQTAETIGHYLRENSELIADFNVVKGFLNLVIDNAWWLSSVKAFAESENLVPPVENPQGVMVEYSSPNTNKPLHLGHIRNCLLGWSVGNLQSAVGHNVTRVQIINDRGIHICKSMVAWLHFANGETPESAGLKGDHLVGKYYVLFDQHYRVQIKEAVADGMEEDQAKNEVPIMKEAREMLIKWEKEDPEVMALWNKMNGWVYEGFDKTYDALGVGFDKNYYESNTYKLGKSIVDEGIKKGVFFREDDGSVWIDLTDEGLDKKILLRSDGTAVYMTQDVGTAVQRFEDYDIQRLIYTVGNEQDYHFSVLFKILDKLGYDWAKGLFHLSYGMVDLPSGKMKSREGTVVDADDLVADMIKEAAIVSNDLGKTDGMEVDELSNLHRQIGLGALKYYILKVDPRKRMTFNPEESIDLHGNTGPFIQYTHARIRSLLRKADIKPSIGNNVMILAEEVALIKTMLRYPQVVHQAADDMSPAQVANFTYELVKTYNSYYQKHSILHNDDEQTTAWRLLLSAQTARIIKHSLNILGIDAPEQM